jgi:hypothetical protein
MGRRKEPTEDESGAESDDDLRPDGNHPNEQGQRRKNRGFFDDGSQHQTLSNDLLERTMNIIHVMFFVKSG